MTEDRIPEILDIESESLLMSTKLCVDCYPDFIISIYVYKGNSLCTNHFEERKNEK